MLNMQLPIYFPDATRGVVRGVDSDDLQSASIEGLVVNTYHLLSNPGISVLKNVGGLKKLMNWEGWIISDSGGFQMLSLIYQNNLNGKVNNDGIVFHRDTKGKKRRIEFSPEKSIQTQFAIGSDIMFCLDDCPPIKASEKDYAISVQRTVSWAKRCKTEYLKQVSLKKLSENNRPKLFAVIQGGNEKRLRQLCAESLLEIGFDGYGFGGWPLDSEGNYNLDILHYTANLTPNNFPRFGLGIGNPQAIIDCFKLGYTMFDCVLPTRDARHQRLYVFSHNPNKVNLLEGHGHVKYLHIIREKYVRDSRPISEWCDCSTCQNYSRAYLRHLFEIEDSLAGRLATIHNLRTYTLLIEKLRQYDHQT